MFESAEVGNSVDKTRYKKDAEKLRARLLKAQKELGEKAETSAVVIVGGVEGAGKTGFVNLLLEWIDARGVQVHAIGEPSDEERERPRFWRFWRALPPKGKLCVFLGSWYTEPIVRRAFKTIDRDSLQAELDRIVEFEAMLSREGVRVIKLWFHISKAEQKRRFSKLEKDPDTSWRVTKADWKFHARYDRFRKICEAALAKTSTAEAPWQVVEATDSRYRDLTAGQHILEGLLKPAPKREPGKPMLVKARRPNVISRLDLSKSLPDKEYDAQLEKLQARLARLTRDLRENERSMILAFEGADAAGKGGAIRRLTHAIDARNYRVISTAAPTDEERARPYLWRFWRDLPRLGRVSIYDRTWYGRVLVERLEGFCAEADWRRAYAEIDAFEENLADAGIIIRKFWLSISPEEQLKRFKDRETTPYKQYKITEEDWRNRAKWDAYEAAAVEMVERTSTPHAPWVLVEADDKRYARVKIMKSVCEALEEGLKG